MWSCCSTASDSDFFFFRNRSRMAEGLFLSFFPASCPTLSFTSRFSHLGFGASLKTLGDAPLPVQSHAERPSLHAEPEAPPPPPPPSLTPLLPPSLLHSHLPPLNPAPYRFSCSSEGFPLFASSYKKGGHEALPPLPRRPPHPPRSASPTLNATART